VAVSVTDPKKRVEMFYKDGIAWHTVEEFAEDFVSLLGQRLLEEAHLYDGICRDGIPSVEWTQSAAWRQNLMEPTKEHISWIHIVSSSTCGDFRTTTTSSVFKYSW